MQIRMQVTGYST